MKARIEEFNALAGHEHIHKGMTSRDLTENVEQLQIHRSLELVRNKGIAVVAAIGKKVMSIEGVTKYRDLLAAVSENMQTDLNQDQIQKLALDYRDAFSNVKTDQLQGTGFMQDGVSYQRVSPEELQRVQLELKTQLEAN